MARKLRTKKGRAAYARRKAIVEPVFGQIETVQNGRRLLLRGKSAARAEWRLHCACHNLLKLFRAGGLARLGLEAGAEKAPSGSRKGLQAALLAALCGRGNALRGWLAATWRVCAAISVPALVTDPRS
mgnify:CR=1 FL=1